ncbi:MAG: hypothetical protein LBQ00_06870 [Syntrophobacterales bacterium]|jgi:hypothetical protein|nr:hypothetical protein [Syntrophobacterales bacterium]
MKNWKTTLLGVFAGIPQIVHGLAMAEPDWQLVFTGVATIVAFLFAKDNNVTGGAVQQ